MRKAPAQHKVTRKTKSGKTVTYMRGKGAQKVTKKSPEAIQAKRDEYAKKIEDLKNYIATMKGDPRYRVTGINAAMGQLANLRSNAREHAIRFGYHEPKQPKAKAFQSKTKDGKLIRKSPRSGVKQIWKGPARGWVPIKDPIAKN